MGENAKALLTSEDVRRVEEAHGSLRAPGDMVDLVLQVRRGDGWGVAFSAHSWGVFSSDGSLEAVEGYMLPLDRDEEHLHAIRGLVHDLNNLLGVVLLATQRGLTVSTEGTELHGLLEGASKATQTAAGLATCLARFGVPSSPGPTVVDDVVRNMPSLLRCVVSGDNELVVKLNAKGAAVQLGVGDIERIVLNLAVNAVEAMPEPGAVLIRTSVCVAEGKDCVRLECTDTGEGVPPESVPAAMQTGVSSKRTGTGLGLSIVRDLARIGGGELEVRTQEGAGAVIAVTLPVAD
jgi:signal transduction histidine kinase